MTAYNEFWNNKLVFIIFNKNTPKHTAKELLDSVKENPFTALQGNPTYLYLVENDYIDEITIVDENLEHLVIYEKKGRNCK